MAVSVAAAAAAVAAVAAAAAVALDQEVVPERAAHGQGGEAALGLEADRGLEADLGPEAAAWRVLRHVRRDPAQVLGSWEALAPRGRAPADRRRDRAVLAAARLAGQGSAPVAA